MQGRSPVRVALLLASCAWWVCAAATAQPTTGHRYRLWAKLEPRAHAVEGRATITFRNHSRVALPELAFHLYPNAFAHERTVFMREGGASVRGQRLRRPGGIDLRSLRLADGTDLLARSAREGEPGDQTQLRVTLPRPLPPGASVELEAVFRVRLPEIVARMGQSGDFMMVAQWFPKLAKLEPDGRFVSFPYHGLGEFYADFAEYELTVEAPAELVIAAPGRLLERTVRAGVQRERYALGPALDMAFAADPRLRRASAVAGSVRVDVFAPRGHLRLAGEQAALVASDLPSLGRRFGPYPYERLVLVLPPSSALGASGMEYPGLIVGDTVHFYTELLPHARLRHELITTHELAHQWFAMLVASNEVAVPVLDEGLAEWAGADLLRRHHGRQGLWSRVLGVPLDPFDLVRAVYSTRGAVPSSLKAANHYRPRELAHAVYLRPALVFEAVARTWGRSRFEAALGRYTSARRFAHPGLPDLAAALDAGYWPGFFATVVEPALAGQRDGVGLVKSQRDLLDRDLAPKAAAGASSGWFARLLYWAQAVLGMLGP